MREALPLVLLALAAGCASTPPPVTAPAGAATALSATAPAAPPPEAPPPADLMMTAVLSHPRQSYAALGAVLGGTPGWHKLSSGLEAIGAKVGGGVDVDRPLLLAVTADQKLAASMHLAAGSGSALKLADRLHLVPTPDGGFRSRAEGDPPAPGESGEPQLPFVCAITPPAADTPSLVCSMDAATLKSLAPGLSRMKADPSGPDYHVEMGATPLRAALLVKRGGDDSMSSGEAFGRQMVIDFANDLDRMTFDLSVASTIDARFGLEFRGASSAFTHLLTGHPEREAAAVGAFWHLPADTNLGLFAQGADPADLETVRKLIFDALDDSMKGDTCPEEMAYVSERLHALFLTGGPLVMGFGNDVPMAEKAVASFKSLAKETDVARRRTRQALESWTLIEVEEPASKWEVPVRELALADTKFAQCKAPTPKEGAKKPKDHTTTEVTPVTAAAHLPKGTLHLRAVSTPTKDAPKDAPPAHTTHIFMVPDGGHTWFAIGENEAMVTARVRAALDGAPLAGTLAARSGLEALKAPVAGGGFITAEGIQLVGVDDDTGEQMRAADGILGGLRALPSKGRVPIPLVWHATKSTLETRVVVPLGAIPEILSLVKK